MIIAVFYLLVGLVLGAAALKLEPVASAVILDGGGIAQASFLAIGIGAMFLGVRGVHRIRAKVPPPTLEEMKAHRPRMLAMGLVEITVGLVLGGMGLGLRVLDAVTLSSWAPPFFVVTGLFLTLLGALMFLVSPETVQAQREKKNLPVEQVEGSKKRTKIPAGRLLILPIAGVGVGAYFLFGQPYGTEIGRMTLTETSTAEVRLNFEKPTKLVFWTDFESRGETRRDFPHLIDYEIVISRAGQTLGRLKCNPLDWHIASTATSQRATNVSYTALIDNCAFDAPAGEITVQSRVIRYDQHPKIHIDMTKLIIKVDSD